MTKALPAQFLKLFGASEMTTPAGFYWTETLGMVAPAAVITLGVAVAAGLAADEEGHRLAMLLPATTRMRLLGATLTAQLLLVVALTTLTGLGIWAGARLGRLDLPVTHIAGATLHLLALGLSSPRRRSSPRRHSAPGGPWSGPPSLWGSGGTP